MISRFDPFLINPVFRSKGLWTVGILSFIALCLPPYHRSISCKSKGSFADPRAKGACSAGGSIEAKGTPMFLVVRPQFNRIAARVLRDSLSAVTGHRKIYWRYLSGVILLDVNTRSDFGVRLSQELPPLLILPLFERVTYSSHHRISSHRLFNYGYNTPRPCHASSGVHATPGHRLQRILTLFHMSDCNVFIHLDAGSQTFQSPHFLLFEDLGYSVEFNSLYLSMVPLKVLI